jgi:hypothetical protein
MLLASVAGEVAQKHGFCLRKVFGFAIPGDPSKVCLYGFEEDCGPGASGLREPDEKN